MLTVPPALLKSLGMEPGGKVKVAVRRSQLVVEPQRRPNYRLEELLTACSPKHRHQCADRQWARGKSAGRELI